MLTKKYGIWQAIYLNSKVKNKWESLKGVSRVTSTGGRKVSIMLLVNRSEQNLLLLDLPTCDNFCRHWFRYKLGLLSFSLIFYFPWLVSYQTRFDHGPFKIVCISSKQYTSQSSGNTNKFQIRKASGFRYKAQYGKSTGPEGIGLCKRTDLDTRQCV